MNPSLRRQSASSAARVRAYRERQKRNGMVLLIEVPAGLPDALVENGLLAEWDAENPTEIRRAIEKILAQMIVV